MRTTRLTAQDLLAGRGDIQRTSVFVTTALEAAAAEEAGVDILTVPGSRLTPEIREAAPQTFMIAGLHFGQIATTDDYLRAALQHYETGAQAFYCAASARTIERLSDERLPIIGHLGLIPWHVTWTGGYRAVGTTPTEALEVWRQARRLEDAGAFGAEIEVVPVSVASAIAERSSLFLISMGSGSGCHAQYLFAEDILGTNQGRYPRHAKRYADVRAEEARTQAVRVAAFRAFVDEVRTGAFPGPGHVVDVDPAVARELRGADG